MHAVVLSDICQKSYPSVIQIWPECRPFLSNNHNLRSYYRSKVVYKYFVWSKIGHIWITFLIGITFCTSGFNIFFKFPAIFSQVFPNFFKNFQKLHRKFLEMSLKLHHIFSKIFFSLISLKITRNFYRNVWENLFKKTIPFLKKFFRNFLASFL